MRTALFTASWKLLGTPDCVRFQSDRASYRQAPRTMQCQNGRAVQSLSWRRHRDQTRHLRHRLSRIKRHQKLWYRRAQKSSITFICVVETFSEASHQGAETAQLHDDGELSTGRVRSATAIHCKSIVSPSSADDLCPSLNAYSPPSASFSRESHEEDIMFLTPKGKYCGRCPRTDSFQVGIMMTFLCFSNCTLSNSYTNIIDYRWFSGGFFACQLLLLPDFNQWIVMYARNGFQYDSSTVWQRRSTKL